jgi:Zn-dependent protease
MLKTTFYIGKVFGIPIRVHISWLIVFVLFTLTFAGHFGSLHKDWPTHLLWVMGVVASLLFFASVLAHELAHSLLARSRGLHVRDIVLFIFGGVSEITDESKTPGTEFLVAVVGPLTSVVIGAFFLLLSMVTADPSPPVAAVCRYLGFINLVLAVFNMIPGYPLDGGRVLRGILWKVTGNMDDSTKWAARIGQFVAYLFIFYGIYSFFFGGDQIGGLWMAFIGWFLENAALSSYRQVQLRQALAGHLVDEVMTRPYPAVAPDASVNSVVADYLLPLKLRCLPVVDHDRMVGLLTIRDINSLGHHAWPNTLAGAAMIPMEKVKTVRSDANLWDAMVLMTTEEVNQLPVVRDGRLEGLLTRADILTFLRTRAELGL